MKKIFMLAAVALFAFGSLFAQDADAILAEVAAEESKEDANATQVIILEDNDLYKELHPKAKNVTLRIDYTPLTGEAIFQYTCVRSSYCNFPVFMRSFIIRQGRSNECCYGCISGLCC